MSSGGASASAAAQAQAEKAAEMKLMIQGLGNRMDEVREDIGGVKMTSVPRLKRERGPLRRWKKE